MAIAKPLVRFHPFAAFHDGTLWTLSGLRFRLGLCDVLFHLALDLPTSTSKRRDADLQGTLLPARARRDMFSLIL